MPKTPSQKTLYDAYRFPGFTPVRELRGVFGDRYARVIRLNRSSKKLDAGGAEPSGMGGTTGERVRSGISRAGITEFTSKSTFAGSTAGRVAA